MSAHGLYGSGPRTYTDAEYDRVVSYFLSVCIEATTIEQVALATGLGGRTVRAVLSEADGREFLMGGNDVGVFMCDHGDHDAAERWSARLRSQITRMTDRLARRRGFAEGLPHQQGRFW